MHRFVIDHIPREKADCLALPRLQEEFLDESGCPVRRNHLLDVLLVKKALPCNYVPFVALDALVAPGAPTLAKSTAATAEINENLRQLESPVTETEVPNCIDSTFELVQGLIVLARGLFHVFIRALYF